MWKKINFLTKINENFFIFHSLHVSKLKTWNTYENKYIWLVVAKRIELLNME